MAAMGIDGMVSGLDTTSLISSLMKAEAMPQTLLKSRVTATQTVISALQSVNTRVSSLRETAAAAAKPASWEAVAATSSKDTVTVTASSGATPSTLSFTVEALAAAQTSVSAKATGLADVFGGTTPSSITIATGPTSGATTTTVDLTGVTDLAGLAAAINRSGAGLNASVVTVSGTESRLQLTAQRTGEAAAFDVHRGTVTAAAIADGTAPPAVFARSAAVTAAADAQITLWAGSAAAQPLKSAQNTFTGVLPGVDLKVSAVEKEPVTLTVARNDAALKKLASDLVGSLGVLTSEIRSRTATTTATGADGRTVVTGGPLSADSAIRGLNQSILSAATFPVGTTSPAEVGIVLGRDGTVSFDAAAFDKAMAADPAKVQTMVTALATRVEKAASDASDPIDGTLSLKIKSQQGFSRSLSDQVEDWDRRLESRRTALQRTYSALEVSLSGLQAQSGWLAGQLGALS